SFGPRTAAGRAPTLGRFGRLPGATRLCAIDSHKKRTSRITGPGHWRSQRESTDRCYRMVSTVRHRLRHRLFARAVFGPAGESPVPSSYRAKATAELFCLYLFLFRIRSV